MQHILTLTDEMGNNFFFMFYNEKENCLYCKWQGQTVAQDIYAGSTEEMNWAAATAAAKGCDAVINDCRLLEGSLVDTTEWATNVWSPAMYKSGIRYNAILQSDDIFSQLSLEAFEELTAGSGHIVNKMFNSEEAAAEWINTKRL